MPRRVAFLSTDPGLTSTDEIFGDRRAVLIDAEAADLLRVDQATIITAIQGGELPGNRIGVHWRIRTESLLTWLDGIYDPPKAVARTAPGIQPPEAGEGP